MAWTEVFIPYDAEVWLSCFILFAIVSFNANAHLKVYVMRSVSVCFELFDSLWYYILHVMVHFDFMLFTFVSNWLACLKLLPTRSAQMEREWMQTWSLYQPPQQSNYITTSTVSFSASMYRHWAKQQPNLVFLFESLWMIAKKRARIFDDGKMHKYTLFISMKNRSMSAFCITKRGSRATIESTTSNDNNGNWTE